MSLDQHGPRPNPSPEIIDVLRDRFGLHPTADAQDLGGSFTLNLLIETSEGRYVARVHGLHTSPARLADIQFVRRQLAAGGVPSPQLVPTKDGYASIVVNGQVMEVERYVEHDANMNTWHRLETGLPYLGRTHSLLQTTRVSAAGRHPRFANHIEPEHALAGAARGVRRMRSWNPTADELELAASSEELAHLVHEIEGGSVSHLPRQLVHGDFWDNNVLFRGGAVVLVTDLDFMGERLRIDDLALTLYFANSSIGGDRVSDARIQQLRTLIDAYDGGLTDHLTLAERRALPAAIARQSLWSMGGWVVSLPDIEQARAHVASRAVDVAWTLAIMHDIKHWQDACASISPTNAWRIKGREGYETTL